MNPQKIFEELDNCILALSKGNIEQKQLGLKKAKAERDYRIKYNQKMIELKLEKCQATLITSLAKSNPEVAELAMERDIAESAYYTCISATENLRLEAEILRTKVAWLRTELRNS
ncbi:hypothetical protein [Clostridium butyricum]|jgi:hypothetical protein|uniref:Uncharacterized protein n=1 Tax=Clostridium butyricum E4 str. BoNT E BL5262 TaxID=632245 RepID=C4IFB3_CLOBU|nr:hypothetical protein [Clostridium butyricum]MDU5776269.1 hypothetical protein [Clostridium perfringens]ALR90246.1 hypothetical protein ATN24_17440 [Clostridium butyricum]ALS19131.1 hypothetical protein ATD26_19895 [Clostridium butyricum]ANF16318.1 hypothetical protein AZ909_19930 [Clostridium butyricum]AOR96231.1 hypothetical protein BBB49_19400 [Clostridium butyricum]